MWSTNKCITILVVNILVFVIVEYSLFHLKLFFSNPCTVSSDDDTPDLCDDDKISIVIRTGSGFQTVTGYFVAQVTDYHHLADDRKIMIYGSNGIISANSIFTNFTRAPHGLIQSLYLSVERANTSSSPQVALEDVFVNGYRFCIDNGQEGITEDPSNCLMLHDTLIYLRPCERYKPESYGERVDCDHVRSNYSKPDYCPPQIC